MRYEVSNHQTQILLVFQITQWGQHHLVMAGWICNDETLVISLNSVHVSPLLPPLQDYISFLFDTLSPNYLPHTIMQKSPCCLRFYKAEVGRELPSPCSVSPTFPVLNCREDLLPVRTSSPWLSPKHVLDPGQPLPSHCTQKQLSVQPCALVYF